MPQGVECISRGSTFFELCVFAPPVNASSISDQQVLNTIVRRTSEQHCVVRRAQIVLDYLNSSSISATAKKFGCDRKTVRRWVVRWRVNPKIGSLRDLQRTGAKPKFSIHNTAKILSIVSQKPEAYGQVMTRWTQQLLVETLAANDGLSMSRSTVQRTLARQDIDIRTVKYWLFTPTDRANFVERRDAICALYAKMAELPADEIIVCFDAKPGIQVLADPKNKGGYKGPAAGQCRRIEFEYRRLGTRSLVAAVSPLTGEVLAYDLFHKDRRFVSTETISFLEKLRKDLQQKGFKRIHLVLDNGSTHISKATSAYFEKHTDSITTYFTPVHASWLNLCENFFSVFSRRYLKHRRYASAEDFVDAVPLWMTDHNFRCHRLRWTYAPHERKELAA